MQEALIGVMFVLAACAGILLLASNPHGGEHLKDLLVGQILWVGTHAAAVARRGLGGAAAGAGAGLGAQRLGPLRLLRRVRDRRDGLGAAGRRVPRVRQPDRPGAGDARPAPARGACALAYGVGAVGYALGLALSAVLDLPSGAVIVWTLAACGAASAALLRGDRESPR